MPIAILGSGKIACDLLVKVKRSKYLKCIMFSGQREDSPGIAFAKTLSIPTSTESVNGIRKVEVDLVFDCTTAESAKKHIRLLKDKFYIDLTPAKLFPICVPGISKIAKHGVNMGSCTVQAIIPKLAKIKNLEYVEVVTTIASESAGMGTRENLSEYLITTAKTIEQFTGAKAKAILIINPDLQAMHNSIYYKTKGSDNVKVIQFECVGQGDFLDKRFGNLDVMTVSAIKVAKEYAEYHNFRFNA